MHGYFTMIRGQKMGEEKSRFDIDGKWLSSESNSYLNRYEDNLEEQSEKIAEDKGIENEKTLDEYLSNMNLLFNEYIVDGALLQCPKATTEVRSIKYDGEVIVSEFKEDASKNRIHIFEERTETINGLIPVTVEDCKGGLRDDTGEGINITSFGNCDFLYDGENVNQLLQERVGVREPALEEVKEASGNYAARNNQYLGLYQIGNQQFDQIDFKDVEGNWTELANAFCVYNDEDFLQNELAQEVAILFSVRWDYQQILSNGDDEHIGEIIGEVNVTNSGLIAAGHLVGCGELHNAFIGKIPWSEAEDGNETPALYYMEEMGGLDLSEILGGIE